MYSKVNTAIIFGIESKPITVETDISDGLPVFDMIGYLGAEVREARERVRTSLKNCGCNLPARRITVSLSPAGIKKTGSGFDLPIAVGLLCSMGILNSSYFENTLVVGELSLDGKIQQINGVFATVMMAKEQGYKRCLIPEDNCEEASLVQGIDVMYTRNLSELINGEVKTYLRDNSYLDNDNELETDFDNFDFSNLNGQKEVRRACEIAAAGGHNLLMIGPPGSGKSFAAKCIPGILPGLDMEEIMEITRIYSVSGLYNEVKALKENRPFRAPHHTVTSKGLIGGGIIPKPGEISMSHKGVLFLDELTEYRKEVIDVLREPLEDKKVTIARTSGSFVYPADFMLVAAMNPCNCGYYPDMNKCSCTRNSIDRYLNRISQPILDRMDITVQVSRLDYSKIVKKNENENSESIRARVFEARKIQQKRYINEEFSLNNSIPSGKLRMYIRPEKEVEDYMESIYESMELSARSYHKILRVARTIADLEGQEIVKVDHVVEAVHFRSVDKKRWKI